MPGLYSTPGPTATRRRDLTLPAGFIPPCLPMMAPRPPSGPFWFHEIKHDGFRIIARKNSRQVTLYDRLGNDLTQRFPLILKAMAWLPSCTIDGEAVTCDDSGVPSFDLLQRRQRDDRAFLCAFDLIELAGDKFDGMTVFEQVCSLGLEGIVSKRKDSRYISGRSPYWLKMKNPTSEAVKREAEDDW